MRIGVYGSRAVIRTAQGDDSAREPEFCGFRGAPAENGSMPKGALFAVLAASIYLLLRGAGIVNDSNFVVWAQAALFGVFLCATLLSIKAQNALWAAIFAALAIGWNPWVKLSAWHQPLPWDKWATAMSLLCGVTAGAFVVRYWGRGETA
jgi:hypothetical protein